MKSILKQFLIFLIFLIRQSKCNTACNHQLEYIEEYYNKGSLWAREFKDSWGRFPSGIFSGNQDDFGNFDQCINFHHHSDVVDEINGQYCLLMFPYYLNEAANTVESNVQSHMSAINIGIGICVPRICTSDELKEIGNSALMTSMKISIPTGSRPNLFCTIKRDNIEFNTLQISAMVIFSTFILLAVMCTSYEISCNILQKPKNAIFTSFSLYSNSKSIMTMKSSSPKEMVFLHGIRSLAIIWIVICHTFVLSWQLPVINANYYFEWISKISTMFIFSGSLGVDTFFLMSSMLLTLSVFRELDKTKRINLIILYTKRYIRITLPLAAAILFTLTFFYYISNGPLWDMTVKPTTIGFCQKWWWTSLLYVSNYVNPGQLCFGHSWYLVVDMQLYFLSPLILYPLWKFRKHFTIMVSMIFLLASSTIIYMYTIFFVHQFRVTSLDGRSLEQDPLTYYATQARIDSWMMGIFTGYILHSIEGKIVKFPKSFLYIAWILTAVSIFGIILGQYPLQQANFEENSIHADAAYGSFHRIFWCLAVSWVIIACQQNYGGILKRFLSLSIWLPVSKLSYCIYLIHLPIQLIFFSSLRMPQHLTNARLFHKFLGDFSIAFIVAFTWALLFEYPALNIIKILLENRTVVKDKYHITKP